MFKVNSPSWFRSAPCLGKDRLYFSTKPAQRKLAANTCRTECIYVDKCLQFALDNELHIGVWGGKTGPELARMGGADAR